MFMTSFHPAPKARTLAFIVSVHFESSYLSHPFVPVLWLRTLLVGKHEKIKLKMVKLLLTWVGKKTFIILLKQYYNYNFIIITITYIAPKSIKYTFFSA